MTADHWTFVMAAYLLTAGALGGYWRFLCRREKQLGDSTARSPRR